MFLSIIIPMYNVEKYIVKCLESVIYQKDATLNKDYEIIIINDGSTDNSWAITNNLVNNLKGIHLYSQQNQGLSITRNNGIHLAKGEYIWFIDSDDWIESFSVRTIIDKLNTSQIEVLKLRAYKYISDVEITELHNQYDEEKIISGKIEALESLTNTPVQYNIYNRAFLENNRLYFIPNVFHEDNEYTPRIYWFAKTVSFLNTPLYYHRLNPNSITSIPNPKRAFDLLRVCESLSSFYKEHVEGRDKKYALALFRHISISLNTALDLISIQPSSLQNDFNIQLKMHRHLFSYLLKSRSPKYIIEAFLFLICNNYSKIYKLLNNSKKYFKVFVAN